MAKNEKAKKRWVIALDDEQLSVLSRAAELYSRLRCGQFDAIRSAMPNRYAFEADGYLFAAKAVMFPELSDNASYGIGNDRESDIAWALYTNARHRLAWDNNEEGGGTVSYDDPLQDVCPGLRLQDVIDVVDVMPKVRELLYSLDCIATAKKERPEVSDEQRMKWYDEYVEKAMKDKNIRKFAKSRRKRNWSFV